MGENDDIAQDVITAIINKFNDEDVDVQVSSLQALGELANYGKTV
jgi:hypothetical protein